MVDTKDITVLSLCSGYGGLELGMSRALANPLRVVAVEVEAYALANLVAKAEAGKLAIEALWPDLRTFPAERFRGCFDFVIAGYPCQPFSHAGKRQGADDPRHLWPDIARIIEAVRPVWCFFENVSGHLSLGFPEVYRSLRDMGYKVEAGLFTAAEVGAPHQRCRLFILAHDRSNGTGTFAQTIQTGQSKSGGNGELVDAAKFRLHGLSIRKQRETNQEGGLQKSQGNHWPARPEQPQYEWEEPRTLVNAGGPEPAGLSGNERQEVSEAGDTGELGDTGGGPCVAGRAGRTRQSVDERPEMQQQQAQSRLGRAVNGPTCPLDIAKCIRGGYLTKPGGEAGHNLVMEAKMRVDRLRLLGNGVVPQQVELAFRTLWKTLCGNINNEK